MTHLGTKKHRNCLTSEVVKGKIYLDPDYGIYYGIFFDHGAFELNTLCNNNYANYSNYSDYYNVFLTIYIYENIRIQILLTNSPNLVPIQLCYKFHFIL